MSHPRPFLPMLALCSVALFACRGEERRPPGGGAPAATVHGGGPREVEGDCETIFNNYNIGAVLNNAASPTFTIAEEDPNILCYIDTYHWNNARGARPVGTIGLQPLNGQVLGPWQALGSPGQGGVQNAAWRATPPQPAVQLRPDTYSVIDSNPPTWSHNNQSRAFGFAKVWVRHGH